MRSIVHFIKFVFRFSPGLLSLSMFLTALTGVTEGLGLALLVPVLSYLGVNAGAGGIVDKTQTVLRALGLPLALWSLLALVVFAVVVQSILSFVQLSLASNIQFKMMRELRQNLYDRIFQSPWLTFIRHEHGQMTNRLTTDVQSIGESFRSCNLFFGNGIVSLFYMGVAFLINWKLAATTFLFIAVGTLAMKKLVSTGHSTGMETSKWNDRLFQLISQHLGAAKIIRASAAQRWGSKTLSELLEGLVKIQTTYYQNQAFLKSVTETFSIVVICAFIYFSTTVFTVPAASLLVFLFVLFRLAPRVSVMQAHWHVFISYIPSYERYQELCDSLGPAPKVNQGARGPFAQFRNAIELRNVNFSYRDDHPVLKQLSLRIARGTTVGIVGSSGSGKTTLVDVLLRLIDVKSGEIVCDGTAIENFDSASWQRLFSYVPQDPYLFNDTIAANIRWGNAELTDHEIAEFSKLAEADGFIANLPDGYRTVVGDRGVSLSGGQRQRIALARALARKPAILILDEATSALDAETEKQVQGAIEKLSGQLTILVIAHRLSTVRGADQILVLERGEVVEQGSWTELSTRAGRFQHLLSIQDTPH